MQDPWWNPAVEEQAIMRIHRIGQKRTVSVRRFIVKVTQPPVVSDLLKDWSNSILDNVLQ